MPRWAKATLRQSARADRHRRGQRQFLRLLPFRAHRAGESCRTGRYGDGPGPEGRSARSQTAAALRFAVELVEKRGLLAASEVETLRGAGYADGEITEIVAAVALNIFTNYFNHITGTEIDFPVVRSTAAR